MLNRTLTLLLALTLFSSLDGYAKDWEKWLENGHKLLHYEVDYSGDVGPITAEMAISFSGDGFRDTADANESLRTVLKSLEAPFENLGKEHRDGKVFFGEPQ